MKKAHLQGFGYGFSQGVIFFAYAAAFILGAYLIEQKILDFTNMFRLVPQQTLFTIWTFLLNTTIFNVYLFVYSYLGGTTTVPLGTFIDIAVIIFTECEGL